MFRTEHIKVQTLLYVLQNLIQKKYGMIFLSLVIDFIVTSIKCISQLYSDFSVSAILISLYLHMSFKVSLKGLVNKNRTVIFQDRLMVIFNSCIYMLKNSKS